MSNIRGMGDFSNRAGGSGNDRIPLLGSGSGSNGNPRKESFLSFLKNFCCPLTTYKSVIFIISVMDIITYLVSISFGIGLSTPSHPSLLAPLPEILEYGYLSRKELRNFEMWRWVSYAFLHADFVHIFSNVFSQMVIGPFIEKAIGSYRTFILYFSTAILGALFAVLIDSRPSVGASIAIYGLLGAYIGFTFLNWNYFDTIYGPFNKYLNLFFIIFIVLLNFSSQVTNPMINNWGHLGGIITGFFFIFILNKPIQEGDGVCCKYKFWFIFSSVLVGGFIITGFTLFYLLDMYKN